MRIAAASSPLRPRPDALACVCPRASRHVSRFGGDALRAVNPHGKYYQGTRNGYLVVDITPEETAVEFWTVPTVLEITDEQAMDARFVVADGDARIVQAVG